MFKANCIIPMKRIFIISTCVVGLLIVLAGGSFVVYDAHRSVYDFNEESYRQEMNRFDKVLQEASDEEIFFMLRLAIYKGYVPISCNDPYYDRKFGISEWYRTRLMYQALNERRKDLLYQIYPDLDILDKYINSAGFSFEKEDKDTTNMEYIEKWNYKRGRMMYPIRASIMQNLSPDSAIFETITDLPRTKLYKKYFSIPYLYK